VVVEAKDAKSLCSKKRVASLITRFMSGFEVLAAIDLDDQLRGVRNEIHNVGTNWRLTAKACTVQPVRAHAVPDHTLCLG
jgi:hypothetical protein